MQIHITVKSSAAGLELTLDLPGLKGDAQVQVERHPSPDPAPKRPGRLTLTKSDLDDLDDAPDQDQLAAPLRPHRGLSDEQKGEP